MSNRLLKTFGILPADEAYMQAVRAILDPLKEHWPEIVTQTIHAADSGRHLGTAGQVLRDALIGWKNQVETHAAEQLRKESHTVIILERRITELERMDTDKDDRLQKMQELLQSRDETIREMAGKIKIQNVVIADQHQKLSSIFGDADNSRDTQKLLS